LAHCWHRFPLIHPDPEQAVHSCPIVNAKGTYRGSEAPFIVNPLNATFVAQLDVERTFSAAEAIRYRFLPLIHAVN
jgi:hypothetical protein